MKRLFKYLLRTILFLFIFINVVVAFHAYKFTHFYNINEVVIKKPEDKTGWDKTKEILFGINAIKQKNTVPDTAYETVILTTKDKLKLEAWHTKINNAKGTICMFHGHGGKKSGNNAEAAAFRKMGYNTLQLDLRAHGNSEGNVCTIGYDEAEDIKLAYDFIQTKGEKNIVLWGISLGAATITKSINDYQLQPNKIILEMPFGSLLQAAEGRVKMMKLPAEPLSRLLIFWGGIEHGFWAFNMKPATYVAKINCPILLQWGKNDPRVSREEIDAIYKNITTAKNLVVYENCAHESLCLKENEKWVQNIDSFLNAQ
jgi:uncharacterized protein